MQVGDKYLMGESVLTVRTYNPDTIYFDRAVPPKIPNPDGTTTAQHERELLLLLKSISSRRL